jgi:biopolymer transport protein TolR
MAMGVSGSRPRLYGGRGYKPMSQINVTPFVDVMLVLLVVFMVTAPLLTVGVEVDLPEGEAPVLEGQDEPLEVTVDSAGQVFVQETVVALDELAPRLVAITNRKADTRIFVRGDRTIDYGRVMAVMATVNAAGFSRVALVMEIPPPAGAK